MHTHTYMHAHTYLHTHTHIHAHARIITIDKWHGICISAYEQHMRLRGEKVSELKKKCLRHRAARHGMAGTTH